MPEATFSRLDPATFPARFKALKLRPKQGSWIGGESNDDGFLVWVDCACGMGLLMLESAAARGGLTNDEIHEINVTSIPEAAGRLGLPIPYASGFVDGWDENDPDDAWACRRFGGLRGNDARAYFSGYTDGMIAYELSAEG